MQQNNLVVVAENVSQLAQEDNEAFALLRRVGFGASDSSIILGVNPFPDNTIPNLIKQKQSTTLSSQEIAIGNMVNVRKGSDLEPVILQKFQKKYSIDPERIQKPTAMFRVGNTPLTVNFDGVLSIPPLEVPVECKFVSTYGAKYYDLSKACGPEMPMGGDLQYLGDEVNKVYLTKRADEAGIPIYYYTQIQQQLFALNAPFGYLAALFDKDWELRVFKIITDPKVCAKLLEVATELWKTI